MLIVRGTKKLRDRMKQAPFAWPTEESTTVLGDWFANALFWQPQVALLVNTRTMIPVLTPLAPAADLLDRVPAAIGEVLRAHGVPDEVVDSELSEMSEVRITVTNDQQLTAVMSRFASAAARMRERDDPDLFSLSMRLSEMVVGPLKHHHGTPAAELAAFFRPSAEVIDLRTSKTASSKAIRRVHQLKVTLRGTKPPIWRRVVVDGGQSLAHLHAVIQAAFGWWDAHLHEFEIDRTSYGIPHADDWTPIRDERRVSIDQTIAGARTIRYLYDFGDGWDHEVIVERTTIEDGNDRTVPDCVGGRRACPPEDCGGPWGYRELLQILADPTHPEHAERLEWCGGPIDPDAFDSSEFAENLHLHETIGHQALADLITFDDDST